VANNLIAQIASEFISGSTEVVDIVTFVEASWGLGITLTPVQKFILKSYYGMELDGKDKSIKIPDVVNEHVLFVHTEKEFLQWLYDEGRCNTNEIEGKNFTELVLAIGRRGGKSTLSSCISNYELYKLVMRGDPIGHYNLATGGEIVILNVAPTDDQAGVVFEMIKSQAMHCPYLRDRSLHQTMTYFDLQTDVDKKLKGRPSATLSSISGGCSAASLRGHSAMVVIMDEMAHFIDNGGRFSGDEVYKALTPSIAAFRGDGKIISISSPYAKYGKFYDLYNQSFDETEFTLMFKMYSAMVNSDKIDPALLKTERRRDRVGFMCEYGAEFSDSVTAWIDDEAEFRRCIIDKPVPSKGVGDVAYYMGIDLGFKNDGTAIVIVHKEGQKVVLDYANVWFSGSSDIWELDNSIYEDCGKYAKRDLLKMQDMVNEIKELVRWFPIKQAIFDQSNGYGLAELLHNQKLKQFKMENFTDNKNSEVYQLLKNLYTEQLIELFDHPVLIPEMLSLEVERKSKRKIEVRAPGRRGAHDDLSDALARAVYICYKGDKVAPRRVATGAGGAGGGSSVGDKKQKMETQASFFIKKRKMHGDHPRGLYESKRKRPGIR